MRNLSLLLLEKVKSAPKPELDSIEEFLEAMVGVHEEGGPNKGPLVEAIQSTVGNAEGEPWCCGLIQSAIAYAEHTTGKKCALLATESCMQLFNDAKAKGYVNPFPERGSLVVWQDYVEAEYEFIGGEKVVRRPGGATGRGHIGYVLEVRGEKLLTIEGNTSPSSEVVREGDGVYKKMRGIIGSPTRRVEGFISVRFK